MVSYDKILGTIPVKLWDTETPCDFFADFPKRAIGKILINRFGSRQKAKEHITYIVTGGRNSWNSILIFNDIYEGDDIWETLHSKETSFQNCICVSYTLRKY